MQTKDIRQQVAQHAPSARSVYPNGLGFARRGWSYSFGVRGWCATKVDRRDRGWVGWGETPAEAQANACPQPE